MTNNNNLKDLFLKTANIDVLLHTYRNEETWASQIASTQDMTGQSARNKVNFLEKQDLLIKNQETNGRKPLTLTENGEKLARAFERTVREIEEVEKR